ncbi:MAG: hypothetical protein ABL958_14015 [Bdellovibrionia bacterium]
MSKAYDHYTHWYYGVVELRKVFRQCADSYKDELPSIGPYSGLDSSERAMQLILAREYPVFQTLYGRRSRERNGFYQVGDEETFQLDSVRIGARKKSKRKVRLSGPLIFRQLAVFAVVWMKELGLLFTSRWRIDRTGPVSILSNIGPGFYWRENTPSRFVDFCKNGKIGFFREAKTLLVTVSPGPWRFEDERVVYVSNPRKFIADHYLNFGDRFSFLFSHLKTLVKFILSVPRHPLLALAARDFAETALYEVANKRRVISDVFLPVSEMSSQPMYFNRMRNKNFHLHFVMPSAVATQYSFKSDPQFSFDPFYEFMKFDEAWVWTQPHADDLKSMLKLSRVHVVGPILWYLPRTHSNLAPRDRRIRAGIFDITPFEHEYHDTRIGEGVFRYYIPENAIRFLQDSVETMENVAKEQGLSVDITLKAKRAFDKRFSRKYSELVENLCETNRISLTPPDVDLFDYISSLDLILVMPFSTPAYVADDLNVPAIYYDPVDILHLSTHETDHVKFIQGPDRLKEEIRRLLTLKQKLWKAHEQQVLL